MATPRLCSIPGCGKTHIARGWCPKHYMAWKTHNDPLHVREGNRAAPGEPRRYLYEVALHYRGSECLTWPYCRLSCGYASIPVGKSKRYVHRIICEEVNGPQPSPLHQAAHSCGKGKQGCVAPNHLSWKTPAENAADKILHGTAGRPGRTLRADDVREIRRLKGTMSQHQIAARYGVKQTTISLIYAGKTWARLR